MKHTQAPAGTSRPGVPYQQAVQEVLAAFGTDAQRGLTEDEARLRLARYGRNELMADAPVPAWRKFLAQFEDALVILLLVATALSAGLWLYERDSPLPYEAIAICAVVLLNAVMGYVQESRADSAVAALRQMTAAHAHVMRDGESRTVPASDLVPGDIILVEEGDTIPADARVIQTTALQTAEASLTGESLPVSGQCVARHQLLGHAAGERRLYTASHVDPCKFPEFTVRVECQLSPFEVEVGALRVGL